MSSSPGTPLSHPARTAPTAPRSVVLTVMCAGMFLVQLDVTVVNVALPHIGDALHTDLAGLQWVVDSYTVVLAAFLLGAGVAGDRWGHRNVAVLGFALFGAASLMCGLAPDSAALVAARAGQGLSAALLLPSTLAVVNRTFPERAEKAKALGIWAGISALALPAGPLLGGVLVTAAGGWRAVFLINLPVVVAALALTLRVVRKDEPSRSSHFDLPGVLASAVVLTALVYCAISVGRAGAPARALTAAGVAVAGAAALAAWERRAPNPMLPPALLRRLDFVGANTVAAAMNFVGIGTVFVVTLYLQQVRGHDALSAGALLLPLFVPLAVCAPFAGRLAARFGPRPPMLAGLLLGATGAASLLSIGPGSSSLRLVPALLGLGLGMGLLTPSVVAASLQAGPPELPGLSSGVNNTARQAGGALGIAVFGAMVQDTAAAGRFTDGLHHIGVLAAALWLAAAALTLLAVPRANRQ
ncbi:MFS transporter [Streptomyces sp. NBC_00344]|uniref:MFS transporter n=1 Tax=Streptomyces sp. NBC_00344 TaxID=2975720 RepID=UPI002E1B9C8D